MVSGAVEEGGDENVWRGCCGVGEMSSGESRIFVVEQGQVGELARC